MKLPNFFAKKKIESEYIATIRLLSKQLELAHKERAKLINALIAKNPQDVQNLTITDSMRPVQQKSPESDLIPLDSLSDEDFDKHIHSILGDEANE